MRIKYSASFFADLSAINGTPESILRMMNGLAQNQISLLPSSVLEVTAPTSAPLSRPRFVSQDGNVNVVIGSRRLDFSKTVAPDPSSQLGTATEFIRFVEKCASVFFEGQSFQASRLAFVVESVSSALSTDQLNRAFPRLFNPTSIYTNSPPFEWTFRANTLTDLAFGNKTEQVNTILKVDRLQGQFVSIATGPQPFDRVFTELDINTLAHIGTVRFSLSDLAAFMSSTAPLIDQFEAEAWAQLEVPT